jgi:ribosomal protein S18 acetylase RimI-like enzyme
MESSKERESSSAEISLQPATSTENDFLLRVYESTREVEMVSWEWPERQRSTFIRMQFDARQRGYAANYPSAETSIILVNESPAGSIIIFRNPNEIRLVDIALLSEFRGRGIGEHLIGRLISEAARSGSRLRLSVLKDNRAKHLYERLGFVTNDSGEMYCEMVWAPAQVG